MSLRAFHLSTHALRLNPANYTVWEFRRHLIRNLKIDLAEELRYMDSTIKKNPKNYQVWHHRRVLIAWLGDPKTELDFIEKIFDYTEDWKNFHAWQHRSWLISHFKLMANEALRNSEFAFTKKLLDADLRNNSAWNYRMFLLRNSYESQNGHLTSEIRNSEISTTLSYIRKVPDNESAWNYLMGLLEGASLNDFPAILNVCKELHENGRLHQFSLDCEVMAIEDKLRCKGLAYEDRDKLLERANAILDLLKNNIDPIRARYWQFRQDKLSC